MLTCTNYWLFFNFNRYRIKGPSVVELNNLYINPDSYAIKKLKKRLCYFLVFSGNTNKLHWHYKALIVKKTSKFASFYLFNFKFLLKQVTTLFNLFNSFLNKNYNFFIFNFDFLMNDVYSFSKWIYGTKNVIKYDFIFKADLKKFRNFKWKKRFINLVKKKKVKITFLLDITNNEFFIDFLKNSKILTVGLVPYNISFLKLDFWFITNNNSYLVKYIFFSYIYSLYNIFLLQKITKFFLYYNRNFKQLLFQWK